MSEAIDVPLPANDHSGENEKYHAFVNLALGLAAITGVELVLVYLPFNIAFVYTVLIGLSLFKFVAVIAWFMTLPGAETGVPVTAPSMAAPSCPAVGFNIPTSSVTVIASRAAIPAVVSPSAVPAA